MPSEFKSRDYPFGREGVDTLIVCHHEGHMHQVIKAFGMKAKYVTWGAALMGSRFNTIIVFRPSSTDSKVENEAKERWFQESVRCRLAKDGELYIV